MYSLISPAELQKLLAEKLCKQRKGEKMSRAALAERSKVPAPTIKKFETTGQISLRQFLLLWQCLDDLRGLEELTRPQPRMPTSIEEVLRS